MRFIYPRYPGEHLTDDYRRNVNRFGKLPCIDDNGFLLAETPAIMRYLVRKYPENVADHWYPRDSQARARVDEFMSWQHMNLRLHLSTYFWCTFVMPKMFGTTFGDDRMAEIKMNMEKTLSFMENVYVKGGKFVAGGDQISFADLLALGELKQLSKWTWVLQSIIHDEFDDYLLESASGLTDYDPTEGRPNIKQYIERVIQATQPEYDGAHAVLNKVAKAVQAKAKL